MPDIKLIEFLKRLGYSLWQLKSFQCDWKVMREQASCDEDVKSPYQVGIMTAAKDLRGGICNSCWARGFAEQELPEVERMLRLLGADVPDWGKIPDKGK